MGDGRLPVVGGRRVIQALMRTGFVVDRIVGSHHVLVYPGDPARTVTVPVHAGRDLKPGTLRSIIRQTGLTVEEFTDLL
ncbi:putative RNA binding protein YcfA (HicA-like mRNA interferase family) [Rhodopseudomonas thermotolerans]|jgi:predicted RNA binding protein YcfA (HicA-like mRNA interferase family)|uniref:RNA binding protein YcfA (HicA-like mRNA interferase family) n=2 Tax=Rhodopseudomonas TaxID=1073 RepID=A0A336JWW4_9BRAD|nr:MULTISPECIES: type II toxin-antitoxin system HicA family toxin [Rhodopseudomonas]RED27701.1 putative RNA binding protein YcfA (HicA-like mRNA interferase family) [Rhodopseudomonas pentothenatexigens]REF91236.1 putative RNA binding protein YcfA (HicA-like mRNA interferase family) [Rhodopseudomonas thermotolerans]SSW92846.1 predicted RNA binding protein YcfA (HicA-like mRNA interferase family) [Rhodopseudomonas pentothenatexigens]